MDKEEIITDEIFPFDPIPHEDITACIQAMGVIEDMDTVLMSEEEVEMVNSIKRMLKTLKQRSHLTISFRECNMNSRNRFIRTKWLQRKPLFKT